MLRRELGSYSPHICYTRFQFHFGVEDVPWFLLTPPLGFVFIIFDLRIYLVVFVLEPDRHPSVLALPGELKVAFGAIEINFYKSL